MKKLSLFLAASLIMVLAACNNDNKNEAPKQADNMAPDAGQKNLETVHIINTAFETKDFSKVKALIAADGVDHAGPRGDIKGADSIIANMQYWSQMTTESKSQTIKEFADKDYAFQWITVSGKMAADGFGMKAGQPYHSDAIEVTRFNSEGKATEHWEFVTMADAMKMMGGGNPEGKK